MWKVKANVVPVMVGTFNDSKAGRVAEIDPNNKIRALFLEECNDRNS